MVNTLRRFVEAMGGQLHIVVHFSQGTVEINQFRRESKQNEASDRVGSRAGLRRIQWQKGASPLKGKSVLALPRPRQG